MEGFFEWETAGYTRRGGCLSCIAGVGIRFWRLAYALSRTGKEVEHSNRSNALVSDGRCRLLTDLAKQRPERHFQVAEGDWT